MAKSKPNRYQSKAKGPKRYSLNRRERAGINFSKEYHDIREMKRIIKEYKLSGSVLEIGSGAGRHTRKLLVPNFTTVHCVELDK